MHNPSRYLYGAFDVGDIDMDGDIDVIAVINPEMRDYRYSSSWYMIYRNDGDGVFLRRYLENIAGLYCF